MKALLKRIAKLRALVIGDVMLDHYIWGDATRISPEAPVPVVEISRDTYAAGGASNVALNITDLGGTAELCGWIGDDVPGRILREILVEKGVEFDRKAFVSDRPTILKARVVVQHQQLCRLDREAPPERYAFDEESGFSVLEEKIRESDTVVLSDYGKGFLHTAFVERIVRSAREAGRFVSMDPKPKSALAFRGIDLMTPNRREALEMAGLPAERRDPLRKEEVCRILWETFEAKNLVITLGEEGMLLSREGKFLKRLPTASREVYDVSGAGDTVISALTAALAAGADLEEASRLANAAAGVVVGKLGTATATPDEILAYVEEE